MARTTIPSEPLVRTASLETEELGFSVVPQQITTLSSQAVEIKTDELDFSIAKEWRRNG